MKKEISLILIAILLLMPFSNAQLTSIEIISVKVNQEQNVIQVLVDNKLGYDVIKETFIINNQYTIIQEVEFKNLESKPFTVYYPSGIKLETLQVIINDQSADYVFTGNED